MALAGCASWVSLPPLCWRWVSTPYASSGSGCVHPLYVPLSISFCANSWRSLKRATSNPNVLPTPRASPWSGCPAGATGDQPWPSGNLITFACWHRQGGDGVWRWKSPPGRPPIPGERQALIRQRVRDNLTWGQRRLVNALRLKYHNPLPAARATPVDTLDVRPVVGAGGAWKRTSASSRSVKPLSKHVSQAAPVQRAA